MSVSTVTFDQLGHLMPTLASMGMMASTIGRPQPRSGWSSASNPKPLYPARLGQQLLGLPDRGHSEG